MTKIKKDFKDSLFVGIDITLSEYKVPKLLAKFHPQMPSISIRAFVKNSQQIEVSSGTKKVVKEELEREGHNKR